MMNDLISRQAALEAIDAKCKRYFESVGITDFDYYKADEQSRWISDGAAMAVDAILDLPSAEKVGKWTIRDIPGTGWYRVTCSECGEEVTSTIPMIGPKPLWDYCPWCGARMEGEEG